MLILSVRDVQNLDQNYTEETFSKICFFTSLEV